MPYLRGEDINIGIGMENPAARGTIVPPQRWIPGRTPTDIKPEIVKVEIKETRASGVDTQGSEIIQKGVVGGLEFNVRCESLGYLLKSWLGKVTSSDQVADGGEVGLVWVHKFEVLPQNPEHPSLSLALSQPNAQDYEYGLALVKTLEIRTPVDDLVNATVGFVAAKEEAKAGTPFDPNFVSTDVRFRHQDVKIKLANAGVDWAGTKANLDAAAALSLKEFRISGDNGARFNQNIGKLVPGNVLALLQSLAATLKADLVDNLDRTTGGTGDTYSILTGIPDEGAKNRQTFTPTKKYQTKVTFNLSVLGTGDLTILIHDSSEVLVASQVIAHKDLNVGYNTAILPWTWAAGEYHVHITSTVADSKVVTNDNEDLETAIMNFYYKSERELYTGGNYKAMRVEMERTDLTIGTAHHPKIVIDLPKVSFEGWTPDRPLEDIVSEGVELKIHYDSVTSKAIEIRLTNTKKHYAHTYISMKIQKSLRYEVVV